MCKDWTSAKLFLFAALLDSVMSIAGRTFLQVLLTGFMYSLFLAFARLDRDEPPHLLGDLLFPMLTPSAVLAAANWGAAYWGLGWYLQYSLLEY